ncbi:uncharacterized protein K452DRAFT_317983 [Aplosporella prunicola CBS 121167]|uniref:Carbohydrate-binding module family 18 protein n=1 Tax=Aplosporella prunicola CBS 121167 TaxID=1176127 RepID=A0A6A6BGB7_9PEZI|nr:uncharacterized protein K452DRAFT_317983 [Aplosporella prunicola CBS 121167]KAF2142304.1 hypothetical protein K452DRAFT_317983 [Aplosporella prunicola CBS 121167]
MRLFLAVALITLFFTLAVLAIKPRSESQLEPQTEHRVEPQTTEPQIHRPTTRPVKHRAKRRVKRRAKPETEAQLDTTDGYSSSDFEDGFDGKEFKCTSRRGGCMLTGECCGFLECQDFPDGSRKCDYPERYPPRGV